MKNVQIERKGDKLILTIDIGAKALEAASPSKTGKTKVIASTHGNQMVEGVTIGLNCYTKA